MLGYSRVNRSGPHNISVRRKADIVERVAGDEGQHRFGGLIQHTDVQWVRDKNFAHFELLYAVVPAQLDDVADHQVFQGTEKAVSVGGNNDIAVFAG